jgi:hypothetical protein
MRNREEPVSLKHLKTESVADLDALLPTVLVEAFKREL